MNRDFVIALLRTTLQMSGSSITAAGIATGEQWTAISGGILAGASVLWMLWDRYNTRVVPDPAANPGSTGGVKVRSPGWLGALILAAMLAGCAAVDRADDALARMSRGSLPVACGVVGVAQGYFDALAPRISAANHARYEAASAVASRVCINRPSDTAAAMITLAQAWADIQAATKAN